MSAPKDNAVLFIGCSRSHEDEIAGRWSNECPDPTCQNFGRVQQRFKPSQDVINIDNCAEIAQSPCRNCMSHNSLLFCVEQDKVIHDKNINDHFMRIKMELALNFDKDVNQTSENCKQVAALGQTLQSRLDEKNNVVEKSSECHFYHIKKHLQATKITDNLNMKMTNDGMHFPLETLSQDFVKTVDEMFKSLQDRKSNIDSGSNKESQVQINNFNRHLDVPRIIKSVPNEKFGACCFTEDNYLVAIQNGSNDKGLADPFDSCTLKIYDERFKYKSVFLYFHAFDVCMYDTFNALVTKHLDNCIVVVNMSLLREKRNIVPKCGNQYYGSICYSTVIFCCNGTIWTLVHFKAVGSKINDEEFNKRICSVDFNGNILKAISLPNDVCDICYDGYEKFYMTHYDRNDITFTTTGQDVAVLYSSVDLREGCRIKLCLDDLLLLENDSDIIYKLNIEHKKRSVAQRDGIPKSSHICFNSKTKHLAVTMDVGKSIKVFKI